MYFSDEQKKHIESIFSRINELNIKNQESLWFQKLLSSNRERILRRIVEHGTYTKYRSYFLNDMDYIHYVLSIVTILKELFNTTNTITPEYLMKLQSAIISPIGELKLGRFREHEEEYITPQKKRQRYLSPNMIRREMENACFAFTNTNNEWSWKILDIFNLCIWEIIQRIHPFYDGNGTIASILVDVLLIREGYLPIDHKQLINLNFQKHWFAPGQQEPDIEFQYFCHLLLQRYIEYNY